MKKTFDYIRDDLCLYCYKGKNQVVELEFENQKEITDFILAIDNYQKIGTTTNKELLSFLENNPEYSSFEIKQNYPTLLLAGDNEIEKIVKEITQKRGFKKIKNINKITDFKQGIGLNIKTNKNKKDFKKNTKFFLDNNINFLTLDLDQGSYGVIGPFCVKKELACPFCTEIRIITNDLLYDFHTLAKNQKVDIVEFFEDEIFREKLITEAINELYFEVEFGRCNLRNFVMNYNFFTGTVSTEGVLPYPECQCQK